MRRYLFSTLLILALILAFAAYFFADFWVHRYDDLIIRQAKIYNLDPDLVWSVIYEETYFRASITGDAGEVGLMQVTPLVAREWAEETGFKEFEKRTSEDVVEFLSDPERNVQIGCWYLEKLGQRYRGRNAALPMTLAAYNAGASRVEQWASDVDEESISEEKFIETIGIASTKAYVRSILTRFRASGAGVRGSAPPVAVTE